MYGYIRPDMGELKGREAQQFRAVYCGLCEALKTRCGALARFVVNYDLTFMAMVLSRGGTLEWKRCPAHPLQKRPCFCSDPALSRAADYSVILAWWKLRDSVADESYFRGLPSRSASEILKRAYRKAAERQPGFDENTRARLAELTTLEREKCSSLDRAADCFARILSFASEGNEEERRIQEQIFYHVGRSVYILDAADDYPEDQKTGSYNPLLYRFSPALDKLSEEQRGELRATLNLSQRSAAAALGLRKTDIWTPILENILTVGLPEVTVSVLNGTWKTRNKKTHYPDSIEQGETDR